MKRLARTIIVMILGWQVRRLQRKRDFKTIAVVGSIGKTSTKFAIAQVLSQTSRVRWQQGNYNDLATVPLVFFGLSQPTLFNPISWIIAIVRAELALLRPYPYDFVVVELGTDAPGQIGAFRSYLWVDLAVVTAISPEHMQNFADLDAVAKEELSVMAYSQVVLVNKDLIAPEYRQYLPQAITYGTANDADFVAQNVQFDTTGVSFDLSHDGAELLTVTHPSISMPQVHSLTAACAVATLVGQQAQDILPAIQSVTPVSGRLQLLQGIQHSTIIDDTYNSSPDAAAAVLQTLYRMDAPQKIAVLGNMNELGAFSEQAHTQLGKLCDPAQITELITLGPDANQFLAAAAEAKGCKVTRYETPYQVGQHLTKAIHPGALVLVKGSQNKVYAEEAVKAILADPADASKLVRQSPSWLKAKAKNFQAPSTSVILPVN